MLLFIIKVIVASIVVSGVAFGIKVIPHYKKWRHALLMQLLNSAFMTIVLCVLFYFGIYPSWVITIVLIACAMLLSVRITNRIAGNNGPPPDPH